MARPDPLAWATRGWLLASAALAGIDAVFLGLELRLLRAIAAGDLHVDSSLRATLDDAAARGEAIGWARLVLLAPTALVYLVWLARAVRPHAQVMRISPTRAVLEYFVPLAQLALPYRTFGRLLAAAAEGTPRSERSEQHAHVADTYGADAYRADERAADDRSAAKADWTRFFWWSTWLATWLLAQLARSADAVAVDVAGFVHAGTLSLGSALCAVVAGLAAERLVHRVTRATAR